MTAQNGSPFALGGDILPGAAKLLEEMGELQQVLGKYLATGGSPDHWDGTNLRERLIEELGDVSAAILFFGDANLTAVEEERVTARGQEKYALFEQWHEEGLAARAPSSVMLIVTLEALARQDQSSGALCDAREEIEWLYAYGFVVDYWPVENQVGGRRRMYSITDAGRTELARLKALVEAKAEVTAPEVVCTCLEGQGAPHHPACPAFVGSVKVRGLGV